MIKRIYIKQFGGIKDKEICFEDGLNIVYGKNEAGKSTIQAFVKAMLYGMSKTGKNIRQVPRKRYMSINTEKIGGVLEIDNYIITRYFSASAKNDVCNVINILTGEEEYFDCVGESILGIGENAFINTLFIEQFNSHITSDNEVMTRLNNLNTTLEETVSYENTMRILDEKVKKINNPRSKNSTIQSIQNEIADIKTQFAREEQKSVENDNKKSHLNRVRDELKNLSSEKSVIETTKEKARIIMEYKDYQIHKRDYNDLLKQKKNLLQHDKTSDNFISDSDYRKSHEIVIEIENISSKTFEKTNSNTTLLKALSIIFAVLGLLFIFSFVNSLFLLCMVFFVPMGICLKKFFDGNKEQSEIRENKESVRILKMTLNKIFKDFRVNDFEEFCEIYNRQKANEIYNNSINAQAETLDKLIENKLLEIEKYNKYDFNNINIDNINIKGLDEEYNIVNNKILDLTREQMQLEIEINSFNNNNIINLKKKLNELDVSYKDAQTQLLCINTAKEIINECYNHLKTDTTPLLNEKMAEILSTITDGKYNSILLSDSLDASIKSKSSILNKEYFSDGTYDAVYFSIRLSIIELLFENRNIFIIADDIFLQYDDERFCNALNRLSNFDYNKQIIYFTCQSRFKRCKIKSNIVEI